LYNCRKPVDRIAESRTVLAVQQNKMTMDNRNDDMMSDDIPKTTASTSKMPTQTSDYILSTKRQQT